MSTSASLQPGGRQAVCSGRSSDRSRRSRRSSRPSCRRRPASMIIVRSPRTSSGRIASGCGFVVGRRASLPERLRHDAEHRAAVESEVSVEQWKQLQGAEPHLHAAAGYGRTSSVEPGDLRLRSPARLLQFDQHAVRARGMDERDERAVRARSRLVVDQPHAARFQLRAERGAMSSTRSVMWCSPGAALVEVLRDRRSSGESPRAARAPPRPAGMKCARTCCDGTSSGGSISSPSASR